MNEKERKELRDFLANLKKQVKNKEISITAAGEAILAKAAKIKELAASAVKSRGLEGYDSFCIAVKNSTYEAFSTLMTIGSINLAAYINQAVEYGYSGDELVDYVVSKDNSGAAAANRDFLKDAAVYVDKARKYDSDNIRTAYDLASETLKNDKAAEPDPAYLEEKLKASNIGFVSEPDDSHEKEAHQLLVERSLEIFHTNDGLPRWAHCLVKRPGITAEERQDLVNTWNRDNDGKKEIFEMLFREIEQMDPSYLDIDNLEDYRKNFRTCDYLGSIGFERENAINEYRTYGFEMSPEREAELAVVSECISSIRVKFSKGLTLMEEPRFKYIANVDGISGEQAETFCSACMQDLSPEEKKDPVKVKNRDESFHFAADLHTYSGSTITGSKRAKEILAYNKEYTGEERIKLVNDWYAQFRETLTAAGIDPDDPVAMARIRAQKPGEPGAFYMPAMKGLNEEFNVPGMPVLADTLWYSENLNSANAMTQQQKEDLYELSRQGKLMLFGADMTEESLCTVYNDKSGRPQVSKPLVDVNVSAMYPDEEVLAKEMFPDAVHPFRVYKVACDLHLASRNEAAAMVSNEDGGYDIDNDEAIRAAYNRTLFRDYFEHPDKYKGDVQTARDRAAQVYTVCRYNNTSDLDFQSRYEQYIKENNISFESEDRVLSDQEAAILSVNDPRLYGMKVPAITEEMVRFVNSIDPVLKSNGYDMKSFENKASLRFFTNKNGKLKEYPVYANLRFNRGNTGYYLERIDSNANDDELSPAESYVFRNSANIRCDESVCRNPASAGVEKRLQIALIYESAKKGQLLFTKPGDPITSAVPLIPGKDGEAVLITDFAQLSDEQRKADYYINADRIRSFYKDPLENEKMQFLKEYAEKIDSSCYALTSSSLDKTAEDAVVQARVKGLNKQQFMEQVMRVTPQVSGNFVSYIEKAKEYFDEGDDDTVDFKANQIKSRYYAARKELSENARRQFFGSAYEISALSRFTAKAVELNMISKAEAEMLDGYRGLETIFFDAESTDEAAAHNIKAAQTLARGTNEEKTALYNERLKDFAVFKISDYYGLSDQQLVENWPSIKKSMYRLQELIRLNAKLEGDGIHGDPELLRKAMDAESSSGDMYYYLSNRIQAIANPVYETADLDQLLNADSAMLDQMSRVSDVEGGHEYKRFITCAYAAKQGIQLEAQSYIARQMNTRSDELLFYDDNGNELAGTLVCEQLRKGKVVYAGRSDEDEVYAFKTGKGSFQGNLQPSEKYAEKIRSITDLRRELRLDKEERQLERDAEQYRKETEELYLSEARTQAKDFLKEEIEAQQYKLALINESYGPEGLHKDKTDEYRKLGRDCAAEILALSRALEQSDDPKLSMEALKELGTKDAVKSIKTEMLKEEACNVLLDSLQRKDLLRITEMGEDGHFKPEAAAELYRRRNEIAAVKAERAHSEKTGFEIEDTALEALFEDKSIEQVETDVFREQIRGSIREEIEYEQYKLGLIIDSYGPEGHFKDKTEDYRTFSGDSAAKILALYKVLGETSKDDLSKDDLKALGSKEHIGAVKAELLQSDGFKLTKDGLTTEKLLLLAAADKNGPEKLQAAADLNDLYQRNIVFAENNKEAAFREQARDAMQSGIDKYTEFSRKLDDVIDYGQYKLAAAGRGLKQIMAARGKAPEAALNNALAETRSSARMALAETFAAIASQEIIDNHSMTYRQADNLSSVKNLKAYSKDIMTDPAFKQFFDELSADPGRMVAAGTQKEDQSFDRTEIKKVFEAYKAKRAEMVHPKDKDIHLEQPKIKVKGDEFSVH